MRISVLLLTAVLLTANCAGSPPPRPGTSASARPVVTGPPVPAAAGTVRNDRTSFLLHVRSVRIAPHFFVAGRMADDAPPGRELIIVQVVVTNSGRAPSHLEATDAKPLILLDTRRGTHGYDRSWATGRDVAPGASIVEPFVFSAPWGRRPASVIVTLTAADGSLSTTSLALPGRPSHAPASPDPDRRA